MISFLYPELCLFCDLAPTRHLFCEVCFDAFEIESYKGRCQICFRESRKKMCRRCFHGKFPAKKMGAVFEPGSPGAALGGRSHVRLQASFMVYQMARLELDMPEVIFPECFSLAKEVGHFLKVPVRRFGPFMRKKILIVSNTLKGMDEHPFVLKYPKVIQVMAFLTGD